jgi:aspartate kinase
VSLTIDNHEHLDAISRELRSFAQVSTEDGQAIICLVGENIRHTPGIAGRAFQVMHNKNIRMISQGASVLNLGFVVSENDLRDAVAALHDEFFSDLDPAVFD